MMQQRKKNHIKNSKGNILYLLKAPHYCHAYSSSLAKFSVDTADLQITVVFLTGRFKQLLCIYKCWLVRKKSPLSKTWIPDYNKNDYVLYTFLQPLHVVIQL